jgi:MFS superfamily sulfate permease-like transporter
VIRTKLARIFPFLDWFHNYRNDSFRLDLVGGLTVALVLVPQSMAYAQLAGLPAYYGLYAAFLPPMVAALFGSSRQLATGPVAVVSLMTATALEPLATAGSESYIAYAILLALLVGVFQFVLGILRLGLVVNFLSHPVVNGFTNAAALIIASSQLSKLFGVYVDKAEHHYETVFNVIREAVSYTHWPTLGLAVLAFVIMIVLRRINPRIPNVLVAVIITTLISWVTNFERNYQADLARVKSEEVRNLIDQFNSAFDELNEKSADRVTQGSYYETLIKREGERSSAAIRMNSELALLDVEIENLKKVINQLRSRLRGQFFDVVKESDDDLLFFTRDSVPPGKDVYDRNWRLQVGSNSIDKDAITMTGGGAVAGHIPRGLPGIRIPEVRVSTAIRLFSMAVIISLLGFMEAISIAKAIAAKTGQRLDPNQELIGQGLANIVGSIGQSYAVSGSFSRSAVNFQAGAVSGLSNVISSMVVVIVLLFLTPLLYHLPQSVLAAIIMMAVVSLVNAKTFIHTWRAQRYDGVIGIVSFICTLGFAPHLDRGIMIGVILSLILYLVRNMKPAIALLSLHPDGTYRNLARFDLGQCRHIAVIRYAGSLFFANVSYLEDRVLATVRSMPELRHILIVGNGINELDASGEEMLATMIDRLHRQNLQVSISGLNDAVLDTMRRTGLLAKIGEDNMYRNASRAIEGIWQSAHVNSSEQDCPLKVVPLKRYRVAGKPETIPPSKPRSSEEKNRNTNNKRD